MKWVWNGFVVEITALVKKLFMSKGLAWKIRCLRSTWCVSGILVTHLVFSFLLCETRAFSPVYLAKFTCLMAGLKSLGVEQKIFLLLIMWIYVCVYKYNLTYPAYWFMVHWPFIIWTVFDCHLLIFLCHSITFFCM